jgi:hypothetical protein
MTKVRICVELPDEHFRMFQAEAKRRGVPVEELIEQCVGELVREMEEDEASGTDPLIVPS